MRSVRLCLTPSCIGSDNPMQIRTLIRSGNCQRWHQNPDMARTGETLAQHQWTVASLILALHPAPYLELVREALWHDVGEVAVGDLSGPFKAAQPRLAMDHAQLEAEARLGICGAVTDLRAVDLDWLIFCDRFAAWLWVADTRPHLLRQPDWRAALDDLWAMAARLGCLRGMQDLVDGAMEGMDG